jgi:hypothetical protein
MANPDDKRSATASERMKRAHQAAAHDTWFREQVQASIEDPRPSVDDAVAKKEAQPDGLLWPRAQELPRRPHIEPSGQP